MACSVESSICMLHAAFFPSLLGLSLTSLVTIDGGHIVSLFLPRPVPPTRIHTRLNKIRPRYDKTMNQHQQQQYKDISGLQQTSTEYLSHPSINPFYPSTVPFSLTSSDQITPLSRRTVPIDTLPSLIPSGPPVPRGSNPASQRA